MVAGRIQIGTNMSIENLFDFIRLDNQLRCNLALAEFLDISIGKLISIKKGEEMSEEIVKTIMDKTDLTQEEIDEMLTKE
jgi:hypothetical protein